MWPLVGGVEVRFVGAFQWAAGIHSDGPNDVERERERERASERTTGLAFCRVVWLGEDDVANHALPKGYWQ